MRGSFLFPKTKIKSENSWSLTQAWTGFSGTEESRYSLSKGIGGQEMPPNNESCQVQPSKLPDSANENTGCPECIRFIPDLIMYRMVTVVNNTVLTGYLKFPRRVDLKCPHHTHKNGN